MTTEFKIGSQGWYDWADKDLIKAYEIAKGARRVYDNARKEFDAGALNVDGYYSADTVAMAALDRAAPKGSKLHKDAYDLYQLTF